MAGDMKIVYIVASAGRDDYTAMLRVSMASLRLSNPGAQVTVVCDAQSDGAIRTAQDPVRGEVDEWLAFETPPGDGSFRSKFLKSSLRQRIAGPYLFLDVDTIVRDDLSAAFRMPGDIAGAPAHSREHAPCTVWKGDLAILEKMQWIIGDKLYLNSGVMWAAESEGAHRLYRRWHEKWIQQQDRLRDSRDQPSLNAAIHETQVACARLPGRYNAQICAYPLSMPDAAIWHYFYSLRYQAHSHIDALIRDTQESGAVDLRRLRGLMKSQDLWPRPFWLVGPGVHMINGSVRDLVAAVEAGQDAAGLFAAMMRVDSFYARRVLAKTLVDAYWGGNSAAFRFARNLILRRHPECLVQGPVRGCLLHAFRRGALAARSGRRA